MYKEKLRKLSGIPAIASFLLPAGLMILSMAILHVAPFGDTTMLLQDAVGQYMDFISYLKTVLSGENDFLYTFSKNLGGDLISLASYYLLSPFNVLFLLSTDTTLPLWYTLVVIAKISVCGFTCYDALEKQFGVNGFHLVLSTAYALMAYNMLYQWNIMWLDSVMILPVMGLGIYRIWHKGGFRTYLFSLAYALLTNFYMGYMLCITSVLFSLAHCIVYDGPLHDRLRIGAKYLLASCISGFGTGFVWLPSFLSLRNGRAHFDRGVFSLAPNFGLSEFFAKLVPGAGDPIQLQYGLPHVFCGTVVLFFVIVFFLSKKNGIRNRAVALCVILVFLVSFYIRAFDVVWHGFSPNNAFNYRYSFIFSYVLICIACKAISDWRETSRIAVLGAAVVLLGMLLFVFNRKYHYVPAVGIGISLAVVAAACMTSLAGGKRAAAVLLAAVSVFDVGANCLLLLDSVVGKVHTLQLSEYTAYVEEVAPAVDYVNERDEGFFRMEKTFQRSHNDAMFFGYNGLSHFSSSEQFFVPVFLQKMGLTDHADIWAYYHAGSTAEAESFLGIRYVLSKYDLSEIKGFEWIHTVNGIGIYRNPNALPLAFFSTREIENVPVDTEDYFALHNQIWTGLTGLDRDILRKENQYTVSLTNLTAQTAPNGDVIYTKTDAAADAAVTYQIEVTREDPLYFYFRAPMEQNVNVFVNGEDHGRYFDTYRWDMAAAGRFAPGDRVVITLVPHENQLTITEPYFYYEDFTALNEQAACVNSSDVETEQLSSSHFSGNVSSQKAGLLVFTIPFDTGWKVYVDGNAVQTSCVLDTLLAVEVAEGSHSFELRYIPRGASAGAMLTFSAVIVLIFWELTERRRYKKHRN